MTAAKEKKPLNDSQITVRLPRELVTRFSEITRKVGKSQGEVLRRAIQSYINRHTR